MLARRQVLLAISLVLAGRASLLGAEAVDGFLTPFESVEVATGETGVLQDILVNEGDSVRKGAALVRLQDDLHHSLLLIAEAAMNSTGRLDGATAELRMRQDRLEKLRDLQTRGSARPEEVARAEADLEIAASRVRQMQQELDIKRLEHERAAIQWRRRTVQSPLDGVVLQLHKKAGEFVGSGSPTLVTVVQLDPLLGVFLNSE